MIKHNPHPHKRFSLPALAACALLSLLGHGLAGIVIERFGPHEFGLPVTEPAVTMVELNRPPAAKQSVRAPQATAKVALKPAITSPDSPSGPPKASADQATDTSQTMPNKPAKPELNTHADSSQRSETFQLRADSIVPVLEERLTYQISLLGMPVGSGSLEASNRDGELRIITRVRSNSVMTALYPVQNNTDTRLIKGRYLLTRIKQREGSLESDTGFNLMFHERKLFWVDRIKKISNTEPLTDLDTLDLIAGFYYLRQQPLSVGTTVTLRLYDGDAISLVPVAVLRREQLGLPGMRSAETLVLKPTFSENGFFKNNRELLIWLTDDAHRVPVRVEATTPIGRVVAELVASERTVSDQSRENSSSVVPAEKMQYN